MRWSFRRRSACLFDLEPMSMQSPSAITASFGSPIDDEGASLVGLTPMRFGLFSRVSASSSLRRAANCDVASSSWIQTGDGFLSLDTTRLCRSMPIVGRSHVRECRNRECGDFWRVTGLVASDDVIITGKSDQTLTRQRARDLLLDDVLSGGRSWLGIGAGWFEREAVGLGLPFPPLKERFEELEEALQIAKQMWSGNFSPYNGKHYHLAEPINCPEPLSKPHPPILIGGSGERKTLRLVAEYGDACNLFTGADNGLLVHKLDVLKKHCEDVGRNYDEIERTVIAPVVSELNESGVSELVDRCRTWAGLGIQQVILSAIPNVQTLKPLEVVGREIIPAVATL
jgi:hypothetical protein